MEMPQHDMIAIGASAGATETLQCLVEQLPGDLPAAIFVVVHLHAGSPSYLPEILSRAGPLPAVTAEDGAPIERGRIYVAPPDQHLIVERGHLHLSVGPKEQHQRPSINVTFRSAAMAYNERVTGVILTGEMDDGIAGLWEIRRRGGIVVVQNPEEALYPSMPLSALREMAADYTVRIGEMGALLTRLTTQNGDRRPLDIRNLDSEPKLTDLTCPDCRGTIWELRRGNLREFRCRVGHTYSTASMLEQHLAAQENALYAAVVALEEGASLARRIAGDFDSDTAARLREQATEREREAQEIRRVLRERRPIDGVNQQRP